MYLDTIEGLVNLTVGLFPLLIGIIIGITCDVLLIGLIRSCLRWCSDLKSFFRILAIMVPNCIFILAAFIIPYLYLYSIASKIESFILDLDFLHSWERSLSLQLSNSFVIATFSNFFTALVALIFITLALTMLGHRVFWPLLERPVYALQRLGIARRNKLFGVLGLSLIALSIGLEPAWLKNILDSFN